jgi:hypothetical protein
VLFYGTVFTASCKKGMERRNTEQGKEGRHEHPLPQEISQEQRRLNERALEEAQHDIEDDPDFSAGSPNDDLDEGESARLGEDRTDLV